MRVTPIARNALFALGMGLLTANYAYATAAVLTPAAGQAVQVVGNARAILGGVVAGGYVLTMTGLSALGQGAAAVAVPVYFRIAGAGAVALAAGTAAAPFVLGAVALGTAGYYAKEWLDNAHAQGLASDFEYDPVSQKIQKKAPAGAEGAMDPDRTVTDNGQTAAQRGSGANCGPNCQGWMERNGDHCGNGATSTIALINQYGNQVVGYCVGPGGLVPLTVGPPTTPTADQWEQLAADLAAIPVNPKILEHMGKPIPVDPVPVINPPTQPGSGDVDIGDTNPAPALTSGPMTINGQAVPISGTSPQQYTQPVWTVTPANDAANPYGVNVVVNNITTTNPATPTNPGTTVPGTATPSTPDVCAQNPNAAMCQPVGTITDPSMPPIPELYVRKYPDGLVGIWQAKTAAISQTSFVASVGQLMPTQFTGGTCPSWTVNLSLGPSWADFGTHEVAPPCWLWDVAKAILIITALMAARRMIFGG